VEELLLHPAFGANHLLIQHYQDILSDIRGHAQNEEWSEILDDRTHSHIADPDVILQGSRRQIVIGAIGKLIQGVRTLGTNVQSLRIEHLNSDTVPEDFEEPPISLGHSTHYGGSSDHRSPGG